MSEDFLDNFVSMNSGAENDSNVDNDANNANNDHLNAPNILVPPIDPPNAVGNVSDVNINDISFSISSDDRKGKKEEMLLLF